MLRELQKDCHFSPERAARSGETCGDCPPDAPSLSFEGLPGAPYIARSVRDMWEHKTLR
jgi:hypothetical protein